MTTGQNFDLTAWVLRQTGAHAVLESTVLQNLWGGYGQLLRLSLRGGSARSAIVKRVIPPTGPKESASDLRKRRSYEVEQAWYRESAGNCHGQCRVAACLAIEQVQETSLLLLEDLGAAGFHPCRPPTRDHIRAGLRWLAHFHSRFLGTTPRGLWSQGTYWHLDTRQEEWQRMPDGVLKDAARALDARLKAARYQTVLHGDSKPANFCWGQQGGAAAVDFQYVGPGCGIRDVAYFLDSCLGEAGCQRGGAQEGLEVYFAALRQALRQDGHDALGDALETEWRTLFPVAWSDFYRFYLGWSGRPLELGPYTQSQLDKALAML
jgi:hypothetical protein